jgi:hypothetical protein
MTGVVKGFASWHIPVRAKRAVSQTSYRLTQPVRRRVRNPFPQGSGSTIVHVAHHRIGTVWFGKVMSRVARQFGRRFSFQRMAGRSIGKVKEGSHLRSGKPGQWREVLTRDHLALLRELTGDLLERLGYESGPAG